MFFFFHARVIIGADAALSQGACERAARKWGPRDGADAKVLERVGEEGEVSAGGWGRERWSFVFIHLERGHHLALFLAVYEVVVVLHRYEGREAIVDRVV